MILHMYRINTDIFFPLYKSLLTKELNTGAERHCQAVEGVLVGLFGLWKHLMGTSSLSGLWLGWSLREKHERGRSSERPRKMTFA